MKSFSISLFVLLFSISVVSAQYSPEKILFSIGDNKVTAIDFENVFKKNYNIKSDEKQNVNEYFDLFLKFRLKVTAAVDAGMDTTQAFKEEFLSYRSQLAKSYLTDNEMLEKMIQEAYEHTKNEAYVSHIMVSLSLSASPADTLVAWNKIIDIRKRLLAGEDFEKLARELSDDKSASVNSGNLGYSRAFRFPYSFEKAVFSMKKEKISMPVRTNFGYHIVKVKDIRPSKGEIHVAHILLSVAKNAPEVEIVKAKDRIDTIYNMLKRGSDFKDLANSISEDKTTKDGELPWFGAGKMISEFEDAAFSITKEGDISKPVRTVAGWHIIKLLERKPVGSIVELRNDLKTKVLNDSRNEIVNKSFYEKLKKSYAPKIISESVKVFDDLDSTVYKKSITVKKENLDKPILVIGNKIHTVSDFKRFLDINPINSKNTSVKEYIKNSFVNFENNSLVTYEDSQLESKYPEFKSLVNEYHDGILLFNIMDIKVWTKASQDTLGLRTFYNEVWSKDKKETKNLDENRGVVISDYQNYIEDKWIAELKSQYKIEIDNDLLSIISEKYKKN